MEECLNSVLQQDFQEYEILCVNDASTDHSGKILSDYAEQYSRIKIITHTENRGLSAARNTGLKNANGKYVMFVDSDDLIAPNSLAELYHVAEENHVDIVYFNIAWIYDGENDIKIDTKSRPWCQYYGVYSGRELFCLFVDNHQMKVEACRQFIRKGFLEERKINFYNGILHEDILFSFFCAMKAQNVTDVNKEYYFQRNRSGSIMHTKSHKRADSLFVIMVQILTYWNSHSFSERENGAIESYFRDLYNSYQCISWFGKNDSELEVGGYVEKVLYSIMQRKHKNRWLTLNEEQITKIRKTEKVIVFGAGIAGLDIVNILKERNIKISVVAVSNIDDNPKRFCGIPVDAIDNIVNYIHDAVVIVGVTEKYSQSVREKLKELGYNNIIMPEKITSESVL